MAGPTIQDLVKRLSEYFAAKINILLVDDMPLVIDFYRSAFDSPLINLSTASSLDEAYALIRSAEQPWHCWLLDIDLGKGQNSIEIIRNYPDFPFVLILSGLQSMSVAAEAVKCGAMDVFDKSPEIVPKLVSEVCGIAALGYILGGKKTQYLDTYMLLYKEVILGLEMWAQKACITDRQLRRICALHPFANPSTIRPLYYSLYYVLCKSLELDSDDALCNDSRYSSFFESSLYSIASHFNLLS
ncbi:MAG: response regulator [Chitinivibrionales bacterium]|nr:response regulator [Chitinivibrionales bacterium]